MSRINDFVIGLAEAYEKDHPGCTWEEAMEAVCEGKRKEVKGHPVQAGYMGLIDGEYRLFSTETDYHETLYA